MQGAPQKKQYRFFISGAPKITKKQITFAHARPRQIKM